jgi:hypothetical protein
MASLLSLQARCTALVTLVPACALLLFAGDISSTDAAANAELRQMKETAATYAI